MAKESSNELRERTHDLLVKGQHTAAVAVTLIRVGDLIEELISSLERRYHE